MILFLKRISCFVHQNINHVRQGGVSVLLRKIRKLFREAMSVPLVLTAIPVVIVIRFLAPLLIIRFGKLRGDRIGHFAGNTELYLCERDMGMHGDHT